MIMGLNNGLQRKFVKVKRGEIFGQVVVPSEAVEKENLSVDFSFIQTEDITLFYQTIHSCYEYQS